MTEFVGTIVVLAIGVAAGIMLTWLISYRMVDSDLGKRLIKKATSKLMDISIEWTKENIGEMQDKFEQIVTKSFYEDEAKDKN